MTEEPEAHKNCWASCLGGCAGRMSGEHIISRSLFDGPSIYVEGGPWPKNGITIGLSSLVANCLCRHHNSELSNLGVDRAGASAFRGIDELDRWIDESPSPGTKELRLKAPLLERWFLKTAINVFWMSGRDKTWLDGSDPKQPPRRLVEAVFGKRPLERPDGLYSWAGEREGQQVSLSPQIEILPVQREKELLGMLFGFRGLRHLIWFASEELPWTKQREFYHHTGGVFQSEDQTRRAHLILEW